MVDCVEWEFFQSLSIVTPLNFFKNCAVHYLFNNYIINNIFKYYGYINHMEYLVLGKYNEHMSQVNEEHLC